MSLFEGRTEPVAKAIPCACCGSASECIVWDFRICYRCYGVWLADDRFCSGAINDALGCSDRMEDYRPAANALYEAEAKKRTAAWVAERKTARAA